MNFVRTISVRVKGPVLGAGACLLIEQTGGRMRVQCASRLMHSLFTKAHIMGLGKTNMDGCSTVVEIQIKPVITSAVALFVLLSDCASIITGHELCTL